MFNPRLAALIRKEFVQLFRDPRTLALTLVMPVMQLFLFGYAATNDVRNVPPRANCWPPTAPPTTSAWNSTWPPKTKFAP
jgi:ABC-2 type transport system permease protein